MRFPRKFGNFLVEKKKLKIFNQFCQSKRGTRTWITEIFFTSPVLKGAISTVKRIKQYGTEMNTLRIWRLGLKCIPSHMARGEKKITYLSGWMSHLDIGVAGELE
jgi:hypothetical protein